MVCRSLALALLVLFAVLISGHSVQVHAANVFTVTKTEDTKDGACDADCSVREAIDAANAQPGPDTVMIGAGTYTLTINVWNDDANLGGDLDITDDLSIRGAGASTILQACDDVVQPHCRPIDRLLDIRPGATQLNVNIDGVTIQNGDPDDPRPTFETNVWGGGIVSEGSLTITNSIIRNNVGAAAGGILSKGSLYIADTLITGNRAVNFSGAGGGIMSQGDALLLRVTLTGNDAHFMEGAVSSQGDMVVSDSTIADNTAFEFTGGIGNSGSLIVTNTTFQNNGIYSAGTLSVSHSRFSGEGLLLGIPGSKGGPESTSIAAGEDSDDATLNDLTLEDAGIFIGSGVYTTLSRSSVTRGSIVNHGRLALVQSSVTAAPRSAIENTPDFHFDPFSNPTLDVFDSTISSSSAWYGAGGVYNQQGAVTLTNVTINGNSNTNADYYAEGGGVRNVDQSTMVISNSTITSNTAASGGGVSNDGTSTLSMVNTVVAGNSGGDCFGAITSLGHNISGDSSCGLSAAGDQLSTNPLLGPLSDNGGALLTQDPGAGSPAIDQGDFTSCTDAKGSPLTVDERSYYRPAGNACDVGAVEHDATPGLHGDANCDRAVNARDILDVLQIAIHLLDDHCGDLADADCNRDVNAKDALAIAASVAGIRRQEPAGCVIGA